MERTHWITEELVEETWQRIGDMTDVQEAADLSRRFTEAQPAIASFILAASEDLSENASGVAYYMGLVLWQCYDQGFETPLRAVSVEEVEALYEKLDAELEALHGVDDRIIERRILYSEDFPEPAILKYIVEAIYEPDAEQPLTEDEQGSLFILMRVVADALGAAASPAA